jgi:hypothetical protein
MGSAFRVFCYDSAGKAATGLFPSPDAAVAHAQEMVDDGGIVVGIATGDGHLLASAAGLIDLLNMERDVARACLAVISAALDE